jgi:hypothetical protein
MKQIFSSILLLIFSTAVQAQKIDTKITWLTTIPDNKNILIYNPQQKLTISDFKGSVDVNTDAIAITSSGFMFRAGYHFENGKGTLSLSIYCSFNKNESWMKEKGKNAYILAHEQRHFDISYLSTLLFIKKVKQTTFKQEGYMELLRSIYKDAVQQMSALQQQYDDETHNGINTVKQEEWNKKIEKKISEAAVDAIL